MIWIINSYQLDIDAIEVFSFGPELHDSKPTILITTKDENQSAWPQAKNDIEKFSRSEGFDLPVLVREGVVEQIRAHNNSTGGIEGRVYTKHVDMGNSCGVGHRGAGTLGGYLTLKSRTTGITSVMGLTNYHVVRGDSEAWPAGKFRQTFKTRKLVLRC